MYDSDKYDNITSRGCNSLDQYRIIHLSWFSLSMMSDVILMFIVRRRIENTFCFTMLSWCFCNLVFTGVGLYEELTALLCQTTGMENYLHTISIIFIYLANIHAIIVMEDYFLSNRDRCYSTVCELWLIAIMCVFAAIILIHFYGFRQYIELFVTGAINIACSIHVIGHLKKKMDRGFKVVLTSITIMMSFLYWLSLVVYSYYRVYPIAVVNVFQAVLYGGSIVNLLLFALNYR